MTEHNIWFWLLESINGQVQAWVASTPAHTFLGLGLTVTGYAVELITVILRYLGLFIGMKQLGYLVATIIMFELILWVKRLVVDNIFSIVKFFL